MTSTSPTSVEQADSTWTPPTWEEIVEQHSARVYRLAYRLTGNRARRRGPHAGRLRPRLPVAAHLQAGHLRGLAAPHHDQRLPRQDAPQAADPLRLAPGGRRRPSAELEKGPEQTYHDARFDDDVQRALDALAPEFRAAVVLCDIEGLSYEEISATLGVKLGTVRCASTVAAPSCARRSPTAPPRSPLPPVPPSPSRAPPAPACAFPAAGSRRARADGPGGDVVTPHLKDTFVPTSTAPCPRDAAPLRQAPRPLHRLPCGSRPGAPHRGRPALPHTGVPMSPANVADGPRSDRRRLAPAAFPAPASPAFGSLAAPGACQTPPAPSPRADRAPDRSRPAPLAMRAAVSSPSLGRGCLGPGHRFRARLARAVGPRAG